MQFGTAQGIYRVRQDGSGLEQLVLCGCYRPSVSPGGNRLTFHQAFQGDVSVRVFDVPSASFVGVAILGRFPEWSPSGGRIAFIHNETGQLQTMDAGGGNLRRLTAMGHPYLNSQLAWSPDGGWILARAKNRLKLVEAATGFAIPLPGTSALFNPAWR